jgi:multidrug efflux pump
VNDFTRFGRNWQVNVQAEAAYRIRPEDVGALKVRNRDGQMIPLATFVSVHDTTGPAIVNHYNMFPSEAGCELGPGDRDHGCRGEARAAAGYGLRVDGAGIAGAAHGQHGGVRVHPGRAPRVHGLAGQYESWTLPLSIILIVPMCLLAAIVGAWERRFRQQHLHADRSGGADRPDGQERHPDRRVREAAAGSG